MRKVLPAALLPLISVQYGLGVANANIPRWFAVYIAAGLALTALPWRKGVIRLGAVDLAVLAFVAYAAESLLWTLDWRQGVWQFENLAGLAAVFFYVRHAKPRFLSEAAVLSIVAGLGLVCYDPEFFGGFGNRNFVAEFLLIAAPLAWGAFGNRAKYVVPPVYAAIAVYLVGFNDSKVEYLCLIGAIAVLFAQIVRQTSRSLALGALIAVPAGSLLLLSPAIANSFHSRLELWTNTLITWAKAPIFGHGLGSFDYAYAQVQEAHLAWFPHMGTILRDAAIYAGAAHNEILQLGSELGIVGLFLAALTVVLAWRTSSSGGASKSSIDPHDEMVPAKWETAYFPPICRPAFWSLLFALITGLVGFPLENPASSIFAVVALGIFTQGGKTEEFRVRLPLRLAFAPVVAVGLAAMLWTGAMAIQAQRYMLMTLATIATEPVAALQFNLAAVDTWQLDHWIREQLMLSLGRVTEQYKEKVKLENGAADKIFRIAMTAGPNMSALLSRAEYLFNTERYKNSQPEMERLLKQLKQSAATQAGTWVVEAYYAAAIGDRQRAQEAIAKGRAIGGAPRMQVQLDKLERLMEGHA